MKNICYWFLVSLFYISLLIVDGIAYIKKLCGKVISFTEGEEEKMNDQSLFPYKNAVCLRCSKCNKEMVMIGALVFCVECGKELFKTKDPIQLERTVYLRWLETFKTENSRSELTERCNEFLLEQNKKICITCKAEFNSKDKQEYCPICLKK